MTLNEFHQFAILYACSKTSAVCLKLWNRCKLVIEHAYYRRPDGGFFFGGFSSSIQVLGLFSTEPLSRYRFITAHTVHRFSLRLLAISDSFIPLWKLFIILCFKLGDKFFDFPYSKWRTLLRHKIWDVISNYSIRL